MVRIIHISAICFYSISVLLSAFFAYSATLAMNERHKIKREVAAIFETPNLSLHANR